MGILGRIWRVIKGWLLIGVEKAEDPEVVLAEAQDQMKRELARVQEHAVQAIAARNQLRQVLQEQENKAANLEARARAALRSNDEELARTLLVEKGTLDQNVESLKAQLAQAEQAAESVKASFKAMEQQVRQRTAQRLALIAGWKQAKIQEQLNRSLEGISLEGPAQAFAQAEERIKQVQAQAQARVELAENNLQARLARLDNIVASEKAEAELNRMKVQMGMAPAEEEEQLERLRTEIATEKAEAEPQQVRNLEV